MSNAHKRVRVCIRVRPPVGKTNGVVSSTGPGVVVDDREQTISVVTNAASGTGTCFHFDQVLSSQTNQAGVYQNAASEIVESVLSGYNGTIMAYGQTGAGKTFTMSGGKRQFEDRGVIARSISSIFQQIHRDSEHSYVVRVSYMEVYNENLYDLLNFTEPNSHGAPGMANNNNHREELVVQENEKGQTFIRGLTRPVVKTEEDALDMLFQGETNRTIAEHCLNASSTRSHCLFTIYIEKKRAVDDEMMEQSNNSVTTFSKLHLVDLAGSERMKKTHVTGVMLKEASHINKSLTFLEQVVIALGDKKRQHIPYRQTPLTNILKDSLGGNCRTMLIACVWPEDNHNDQTLATLKFATRMMRVKTSAMINVAQQGGQGGPASAETQVMLQKYLQEIKRLREELAIHDTLAGRSFVEYDVKSIRSTASRSLYRNQVKEYLRDEHCVPEIVNLEQTRQFFSVFREVCLENQATLDQTSSSNGISPPAVPLSITTPSKTTESRMVKQFRAMRAGSLPLIKSPESQDKRIHGNQPETPEEDHDDKPERTILPPLRPFSAGEGRKQAPTAPVQDQRSEKELFEAFKQQESPRPESLLDLDVAKQNLRQAKAQFANLGLDINRLKLDIDGLTLKLQEARQVPIEGTPADTSDTSSSGTDFLVLQLKDAKKQYRERFESFQEKKAEVKYLLKIKDQMLDKVTRDFEVWKLEHEQRGW
ncbi:hypothetical protein Poli38472_011708 [Pythium oligandrum]|uniref:Kinesin-like protein n=1 Tax=Pythium oligandrum TaxID=41045 RepID=A0A8K1C7Y9_PYTOL|nr:hypothetical protein Poli38472_011708 [Pythium oligandrum]|eukprot:TMW58120.1 hypothetical protein Poli38472_011708 [Pythium oligandrum]